MVVLDASVAVDACLFPEAIDLSGLDGLVAPPLLWPETRAVLRLNAWHGRVERPDADAAHERLLHLPVEARNPEELGREAWRVADELGWGRTYDAEYVGLARLLDCPLVTLDGRLRRGASRVVDVRGLGEL